MKKGRISMIVLLVIAVVATILWSDALIDFALTNTGLGWFASYLFPKILLLVFAAGLAYFALPFVDSRNYSKPLAVVIILGLCIGSYCAFNIPYVNDWYAYGSAVKLRSDGNSVQDFIMENNPEFDGLVCLALPNCPHCNRAMGHLAMLKQRVPDLDIIVFVFTSDSSEAQSFEKYAGEVKLPFFPVPDPSGSIELSGGSFPTFLYFRDGKFVHRWSNNEFGYPAMDWIESRLQ